MARPKAKKLTIKILKPILLHKDMKKYSEAIGTELYEENEIVENVHFKYKEAIEKLPEYIEIMEIN